VAASEALPAAVQIPREAFVGLPAVGPAFLSPDARFVVYQEALSGVERMVLYDIEAQQTRALFTTKSLGSIAWSADSRRVFVETDDGIAECATRLHGAPGLVWRFGDAEHDRLLATDKASPEHFFAQRYVRETQSHELLRVSLDGSAVAIHSSETPPGALLQPLSGEVLFLTQPDDSQQVILAISGNDTRPVHACAFDEVCVPVAYGAETNTLTVIENGQHDLSRAVQIDLSDGSSTELHRDPQGVADIDSLRSDWAAGQPLIATYWRDYKENYGLTPLATVHVERIEHYFGPEASLTLQPRLDANPWLVTEQRADRRALHHHLYWPATGTIDALPALVERDSMLVPENLAPVTPFTFVASDNRTIHAYLTLPRGRDIRTAPLIVHPHGGPWNRDVGTFSIASQFLANRGYIVYQPNFRGSSGYGRSYLDSANRDFGDGRVQDDIIEGLMFLLENGIGDRDRLAIYGHSFGGFATLTALTFTPDLFRAGVAVAPPSDLGGTMRRMTRSGEYYRTNPLARLLLESRLGDIEDPVAMQALHRKSPLAHVDRVQRPLLILAGEEDERVSRDEVVDYALRLDALDKPLSLLMVAGEGHSYEAPHNREAYLYLLETMMARHLGRRAQPLTRDNPRYDKIRRLFQNAFQVDRLGLAGVKDGY